MAQTLRRGPVSATAAARTRKKRPFFLDFYSTAVGKKIVMALTGLMLVGFVVVHMIGNLKLYLGTVNFEGYQVYDVDIYGAYLRELLVPILPHGVLLWIMRFGLLGALVLHVHAAWSLTVMNRKARPVKYQSGRDYQVANFASLTMRYTGIVVLLFILWHLADLTLGWVNPEFEEGAVYHNVAASLGRWWVAIIYIVANIMLGVHLFHGVWSMFQSLGWNSPRFNSWRRGLAVGVASLVVVGNVSFPIMTLAGVIDWDSSVPTVEQVEEMNEGSHHDEMHDDEMHDDEEHDEMHDEENG